MQNLVCHFVPGALKERLEVRSGCAREAAGKDAPSRTRHTLSSKMDSNKRAKSSEAMSGYLYNDRTDMLM